MNIAIVHYHLERGGVTQVIMNHLRALDVAVPEPCRVLLLHGGGDGLDVPGLELKRIDVSDCEVRGLGYDTECDQRETGSSLAFRLSGALEAAGFRFADTVLHVHNPTLGKNARLPGALVSLARAGFSMLLELHDFAEDFRPQNYRHVQEAYCKRGPADVPAELYPQASHIHYAVLNGRDRAILSGAGIAKCRLHLLPNPVVMPQPSLPRVQARARLCEYYDISADTKLLLYPTRSIRRKNVGEALLWSVFAGPKALLALTLPPSNPIERATYQSWRQAAQDLGLHCAFEIGDLPGLTLADNMAAADSIITTSVAEGFGMVFLEPWLAGKPLRGRNLPDITHDFVADGLQFEELYSRLWIPMAWIGLKEFRSALLDAYQQVLRLYNQPLPARVRLERMFDEQGFSDRVDFAVLNHEQQQQVLRKVRTSRSAAKRVVALNDWIEPALSDETSLNAEQMRVIENNAKIVKEKYSIARCGQHLHDVYCNVLASPRTERISPPTAGGRILSQFLDLSRFHPIRTEV